MTAIVRSEAEGREPAGREDGRREGREASWSRGLIAVAFVALAVWLSVAVPLAAGQRSLFFRDVFGNHFALKAFGADELAAGEIPAFNPTLGMGQPFRGNPSALAFYPGNLLYLLLPLWSAFNLHYALHWLLAALAMYVLARRLDLGAAAALLAALTYAGSGWMLSNLSFYNLVAVAAWWPLAMAGAVAGGRRGIALGGAACGMALLAGEPVTATLALAPLLLAACHRRGVLRGLAVAAGVGAVGLAVALPQVVATARVLGFSFRGTQGVAVEQAASFALTPLRFLELLLPLPLGWPLDLGPGGWWLGRTAPSLGYYLSLYAGLVALLLAAAALRRHRGWAALAVAGVVLAWLLGAAPRLLLVAGGGLFRFPEKLLVWPALALPLLAAWGLERLVGSAAGGALRWPRRAALAGGAAFTLCAVAVAVLRPRLVAAVPFPDVAAAQSAHWNTYLAVAAVLLLAAAVALERRAAAVLVALQLVALLQLFPLLRTTPTAPFRQTPPWVERLPPGAGVANTLLPRPAWEPLPAFSQVAGTRASVSRRDALDLFPVPGLLHGLTYPLAPDVEGMSSPLYTFLSVEVARLDWPRRVPWLRTTGVDAVVAYSPPGVAGLTLLDTAPRQGALARLYRVEGSAPDAWWPRRVVAAAGPRQALQLVSALRGGDADPLATAVVSRAVVQDPAGSVRLLEETADRVVLDVDAAGGGLAVVRRSYHPLYRATSDGHRLDTLPVQLTLLGVVVPPGRHRVELTVDERPEAVAGALSLLALVGVLLVALRRRPGARAVANRPADGAAP